MKLNMGIDQILNKIIKKVTRMEIYQVWLHGKEMNDGNEGETWNL